MEMNRLEVIDVSQLTRREILAALKEKYERTMRRQREARAARDSERYGYYEAQLQLLRTHINKIEFAKEAI